MVAYVYNNVRALLNDQITQSMIQRCIHLDIIWSTLGVSDNYNLHWVMVPIVVSSNQRKLFFSAHSA